MRSDHAARVDESCFVSHAEQISSDSSCFGPSVSDRDLTNATHLKQWIARTKDHEMARLGVGGPSLTSASFRAGIDGLTATLDSNTERLLDAEKAKSVKTLLVPALKSTGLARSQDLQRRYLLCHHQSR